MRVRAALLLTLLCSCATATPSVKYYDFSPLVPTVADTKDTGLTVRVERFSALPGVAGPNISMRRKDFRIDSYHYHRWRASSADLITELLADVLASAGEFQRVDLDSYIEDTDVILSGKILQFEGVATPNGSIARVSIVLTAQRPGSEDILFSRQFDREVDVSEHSILALVSAFREAVVAISAEASDLLAGLPETGEQEAQVSRAK